jgi:general secretion pathway protein G
MGDKTRPPRFLKPIGNGIARGFTLVELLVVLAILGLLAGLVGPQVMKYFGSSKTKVARLQIEDIAASLDLYRLDVGRYPSDDQGLSALVERPPGVDHWNGPYLRKATVPNDPWGNPYRYRIPGEHDIYDLYSLGADDAVGGGDQDQDILGWE